MTTTSTSRRILVLPRGELYHEIITPETEARLRSLGEIVLLGDVRPGDRRVTPEEIADLLPGVDAVLTSWGAPRFDDTLLDRAGRLKLIAHAAGTVKGFIPPAVFERGIRVTHAAAMIADAVGEWTLTATLMALRKGHQYASLMEQGGWKGGARAGPVLELYRKRVGIVAASMTGRAFIRLLKSFDVDVLVFDPYLSPERAAELGVRRVESLDKLFAACDVVSNHAPTTPETNGMIGAAQLAKLPDGGLFVNTARAAAIDYDALTRELESGRIWAALDVFPKEPLDPDSPLRRLPNALLSPHIAGFSVESRRRLGESMVDEIARCFAGEPLRFEVTAERLATMA